ALIGNLVRSLDRRWTGGVVIEFPEGKLTVCADTASHVNNTRRSKVRPGEFLLARPSQLHWLSGGFGQTRGFDRSFTGVLAAVRRPSVGHDDAYSIARDVKCFGQLVTHCEGTLRSRPHSQLAVLPFGQGGARFEGSMRDVCDGVGLCQSLGCGGPSL